jgi:Domain of unknown function (DUF4032)
MPVPSLSIRPGNPDFLDLPWHLPVERWSAGRLVEMPVGVHRHPIAFVAYGQGTFAVKENTASVAAREYDTLRTLEARNAPSVLPAGLVRRPWLDDHAEGAGVVITRYADYAFPYRELVQGASFGLRRDQILDAFAGLLVELHLAGCFWGDCSLSNVLYRFDAGAIETIMVDAETATLYDAVSAGRRREDLAIMQENLAGGMADIAAAAGRSLDEADVELGVDITKRYEALWGELNHELVIAADERYLIHQRVERLNDLGFAVHDIAVVPDGADNRVRISVRAGGRTFHSDRLRHLTGIEASENQARHILADIARHQAHHGGGGTPSEKAVAIMGWRADRFEPFTTRIAELHPGFDPVQGYADFLNYRHDRSIEAGRDVPSTSTFDVWLADGMPGFPT